MHILECQELAKDMGFDSAEFLLCGPQGSKKCKWLDAYYGMFTIEGVNGFVMAKKLQFNPLVWCEDLQPGLPRGEGEMK